MKGVEDSHGIAGVFWGTQTRTTKYQRRAPGTWGRQFFCRIYKTDFL